MGVWLKEEVVRETSLPEARLYERVQRLVEQLSAAPDKSIPQACGSVHEVKAVYRFLMTPPSLRQTERWIAQLGGFPGRKGDGERGVKVLWPGWTRL